jgi:hypothetical protein
MVGKPVLREFNDLLSGSLPDLGPGPRPDILPHATLTANLDPLLANSNLPSVSRDLIRSLILIWHDRLEPAHMLAQGIESPDGSFLHGIVHRREPDYGNAKYWFRRVGSHAAYPVITLRVGEFLEINHDQSLRAQVLSHGEWEPFAFIDLCEKASRSPLSDAQAQLLREVQRIELEVLLDHFANS